MSSPLSNNLFLDLVNFLYFELKRTPKVVYGILIAEVLIIMTVLIIPLFAKAGYIRILGDSDKKNKIAFKIETEEGLKNIDFTKKVAFLFGSEASGLSNNEISYANYTLQIPTNPDFKSLNLSHSLIIIAQYVSSIIKMNISNFKKSKKVKAASKKEIHSMTNLCLQNLDQINFFKPKEKKPIMLENLRNIFYRMELSSKETRILASVFASLGKKR